VTLLPYLRLELRRVLRNRRYVLFVFAVPIAFYLLFTAVYGDQASSGGLSAAAYLMVSMATYSAMLATTQANGPRLATERASGWTTQLRATPLPAWAYIATKAITAMLIAVPAIALIAVIAALHSGVHLSAAEWAQLGVTMWLGSLAFAALGLCIGYLLDADTAQGATILLLLALAMLGGIFVPVDVMPDAMRSIAPALPSYRLADLGWRAIAGEPPLLTDGLVLAGYSLALAGLTAWRYRRSS
jgi:ABC-2 type transport system permease protein